MDGTDEVAKKKSKKGKDKDSSKLEKALKVSPRLCDRRPPADPAHRDQCTLITERERGLLFPRALCSQTFWPPTVCPTMGSSNKDVGIESPALGVESRE